MNRTVAALAIACLLLTGCATRKGVPLSQSFHPQGPMAVEKKMGALMVAMPEENRPSGKDGQFGMGMLAMIPGVPCAPQGLTPERYFKLATRTDYDFVKDLGATIAADLQAAGFAGQVIYQGENQAAQATPADKTGYVLKIKLNEGIWHRWIAAYGTSFLASMVWIYGIPVSYGSFDLKLEATLQDARGTELGRQAFSAHIPLVEVLWDNAKIQRSIPGAYGVISPELRKFVASHISQTVAVK